MSDLIAVTIQDENNESYFPTPKEFYLESIENQRKNIKDLLITAKNRGRTSVIVEYSLFPAVEEELKNAGWLISNVIQGKSISLPGSMVKELEEERKKVNESKEDENMTLFIQV